jgi:hypothetical protein
MKRILTLVVEVEQPEGNWIWESHLKGRVNGVTINSISEGDLLTEVEEAREDLAIMRKRLRYED